MRTLPLSSVLALLWLKVLPVVARTTVPLQTELRCASSSAVTTWLVSLADAMTTLGLTPKLDRADLTAPGLIATGTDTRAAPASLSIADNSIPLNRIFMSPIARVEMMELRITTLLPRDGAGANRFVGRPKGTARPPASERIGGY